MEEVKRKNIVLFFKESLTDFIAVFVTVMITLTGFRALYLVAILSVNGHLRIFNPFLKRATKSTLLFIKLQQIEKLLNDQESDQNKKRL